VRSGGNLPPLLALAVGGARPRVEKADEPLSLLSVCELD
jgi:hypothetical protein